jgi:DNA gyrase/topoisomerase IV subunit B
VFTARYALSPYIKQIRFVFKGLITAISQHVSASSHAIIRGYTLWLAQNVHMVHNGIVIQHTSTSKKLQLDFKVNLKTSEHCFIDFINILNIIQCGCYVSFIRATIGTISNNSVQANYETQTVVNHMDILYYLQWIPPDDGVIGRRNMSGNSND